MSAEAINGYCCNLTAVRDEALRTDMLELSDRIARNNVTADEAKQTLAQQPRYVCAMVEACALRRITGRCLMSDPENIIPTLSRPSAFHDRRRGTVS